MELHIISAVEFEVLPTLEILKDLGIPFQYHPCGIGSLNAAKSVTALSAKIQNKKVIFIGTCGSFSPFDKIELIKPSLVKWLPTCERYELSWSIENISPDIILNHSSDLNRKLPEKTVICCPNISKSNRLPHQLLAENCVENLELYSIAHEINTAAQSFTSILAITNQVGIKGRVEWKNNFIEASILTAQYIKSHFSRGSL